MKKSLDRHINIILDVLVDKHKIFTNPTVYCGIVI